VKHVMLRHNGELRIESTLGKGSKFALLLPNSRLKLS
jgi:two-component system, OmpR family, phosphate regulon sensor histidine kinase PhoR